MCAHLSGTVGMPGKLGAGTVLHCPARHWSRWSIPLFAVIALISFRLTLSCLLKDQTMSASRHGATLNTGPPRTPLLRTQLGIWLLATAWCRELMDVS